MKLWTLATFLISIVCNHGVAGVREVQVPYNPIWHNTTRACAFFFARLLHSRSHRDRTNSIEWSGERPNENLFDAFIGHPASLPAKGTKTKLLTFDDLSKDPGAFNIKTDGGKLFYNNEQLVSRATPQDREVLGQSQLETNPHEVMRIRVLAKSGNEFVSQFLHGSLTAVPGDPSRKVVDAVVQAARQSGEEPVEIDILHSHPLAEYHSWFEQGGEKKTDRFYLSALSGGDLWWGPGISEKFKGITVKMRAVTPQGITYSMNFRDGYWIR